jgi:hypothetical protein
MIALAEKPGTDTTQQKMMSFEYPMTVAMLAVLPLAAVAGESAE